MGVALSDFKLAGAAACLIVLLAVAAGRSGAGTDSATAALAVGDVAASQDAAAVTDAAAATAAATSPPATPPSAMAADAAPVAGAAAASKKMVLRSVDGPVLGVEVASFKAYIAALAPATDNIGDNWAQGKSGVELKAMGLVYQVSGDLVILQKMMAYCDVLLAGRNDLAAAPRGQYKAWTGTVAPVWPHTATVGTALAAAGAEQGDPIGHLAYCAKLILKTAGLADRRVPAGDPHRFGKTYFERAWRYVRAADESARYFVLRDLISFDGDGRYRYAAGSPRQGGAALPWDQQMMLNYAFMTLSEAHHLLGDDAALEARYRNIVDTNLAAFFKVGVASYQNPDGRASYRWAYARPGPGGVDRSQGALDVAGLSRAFDDGSYHVTGAQMQALANTFIDGQALAPNRLAGRGDGGAEGRAAAASAIDNSYLLLAQFRPDTYRVMMAAAISPGVGTASIDLFANVLWLKDKRAGP